ncbi:MAG: BREX-1 system phosphatase PglZ type A [Atopobiaceae bacterium]|nr:BREX-1 system phosphatase PglZ type A [Atopobiaceae bacterium]
MTFDPQARKRIEQAFAKTHRRIVFWEDDAGEFADAIHELELDCAEIAIVDHDEFATKRRVLRDEADSRFLVYRSGGAGPEDEDFLLDIKKAAEPFSCSVAAMHAQDTGLRRDGADLVARHQVFFDSKERREWLVAHLDGDSWLAGQETSDVELAMVAVCCGVKPGIRVDVLRGIGRAVAFAFASETDTLWRTVERCDLCDALWAALREGFGYESDNPGIDDFCLELFSAACFDLTGSVPTLTTEAALLVDSMSRDSRAQAQFNRFVERTRGYVTGKLQLDSLGTEALAGNPYLPDVDRVLLARMLKSVEDGVDERDELRRIASRRAGMPNYENYRGAYECLLAANEVLARHRDFEEKQGGFFSCREVFDAYVGSWHLIDRWYRAFHAATGDGVGTVTDRLHGPVEARYVQFLRGLAIRWQAAILEEGRWAPVGIQQQRHFFLLEAGPSSEARRTAVVISDALRYECAKELSESLSAGGLEVGLQSWLSALPSYTQLGMAALLPNQRLTISSKTLKAYVDGQDAKGTVNRQKILSTGSTVDCVCVAAKDILTSKSLGDASKRRLAYIYHNKVDKKGDDITTEREVFAAVREAIDDLDWLVRKLLADGYRRVYVTADHGFLYQDGDPHGFEYADIDARLITASSDAKSERRFVVAPDIAMYEALMPFSAHALGLEGDFVVGIPKGIRRLRLSGSGARFVHGGLTLQETVIPVMRIERKKGKDSGTEPVGAELLTGGKTTIVGADVSFEVLQAKPVSANLVPTHVRVAVYDANGKPVSQVRELDLASEDYDSNARRTSIRLALAQDIPNGAQVTLRLDRRIGDTNKYVDGVAQQTYRVRRNFGMSF